jgi:hypothetical protein
MKTIIDITKVLTLLVIGLLLGILYMKHEDRIKNTIKVAKEEWKKEIK